MRNKIKYLGRSMICAAMVSVALPAVAETTAATLLDRNSCDYENNLVNPALALCSTHVYNIGVSANPSDGGDREMMREVVALKTTVITQQMYKQYEYLESMMRRFKTQLEKSVLTTKLMAANGGNSSSSSSGSSSSSSSSGGVSVSNNRYSNIIVDGARDCDTAGLPNEVFQCVLDNISITLNALDEGKTSEAKRQLQKDYEIAVRYGRGKYNSNNLSSSGLQNCRSMGSGTAAVRKCATDLRSAVVGAMDDYEKEHRTTTPAVH